MASSTLMPPIVASIQPAFDILEDSIRIYCSLSSFNSKSDINHVQVSVHYQSNNRNAIATDTDHPTGLLIKNLELTSDTNQGNSPYFITISQNELKTRVTANTILKVQLRFSKASPTGNLSQFFQNYLDSFSEWSTVTLIRGIIAPSLTVEALEGESCPCFPSVEPLFNITFNRKKDKNSDTVSHEVLKTWQLILRSEDGEIIKDSGEQIYNAADYIKGAESNSFIIEGKLPYEMEENTVYFLELFGTTKNGYSLYKKYKFITNSFSENRLEVNLETEPNAEDGYILFKVKSSDMEPSHTGVVIRRTDSRSNFSIWEDLAIKTFLNQPIVWDYYDFTAESGVFYQYAVQSLSNTGTRGALQKSEITVVEYESAFLYEKDKQLKLAYDFHLDSYQNKVYETVVETIGDQYAHIIRNGNINYRTFTCSGLIAEAMDINHTFTTEDEYMDNQTARWEDYRDEQKIYYTYDYTRERNFRQKVIDFLYDSNIKLFKSLQEGNILIKFDATSISLSPKQELGRLVYAFSATAYEVGKCNVENYIQHNLLDAPVAFVEDVTFTTTKMGRIDGAQGIIHRGTNIIQEIGQRYNAYGKHKFVKNGIKTESFVLTYLRFEFESDPYLIDISGREPRAIDDDRSDGIQETPGVDTIIGYIIQVDNNKIVIPSPNNIYELKGDNIKIESNQSIKVEKDSEINIDYVIELTQSEVEVTHDQYEATNIQYEDTNGQVLKTFDENEEVYTLIYKKYFVDNINFFKSLAAVYTANIEANPGTEFTVKYSNGEIGNFIIGATGELFIDPMDKEVTITSIKFKSKTRAIINYFAKIKKGTY